MTHLLDTSALLAHYLAEKGAERVQQLFENDQVVTGTSILALFEFELRLAEMGLGSTARAAEVDNYRTLLDRVCQVDETVRIEAIRLRTNASQRISAIDVLIAASASGNEATLVHRDPHFAAIPAHLLKQEMLGPK
jgi:predicted nucleic acid-binding protein